MDRREFVKGGLLGLALSQAPTLFWRTALAAGAGEKILVVVQLSGGNDQLNTLVPYRQALYYRLRPRLAVSAQEVLDLNGRLGLHPALRPLMPLYEAGALALIPQVGYPNPSRSHFVSMAVWHTADPERKASSGWLGRLLDQGADPLCETYLGASTPLALTGSQALAPSVEGLEGFELRLPRPLRTRWEEALLRPRQGEAEEVRQAFLRLKATLAQVGRARGVKNRVGYPNHPFGRALADVARMIAAELPTRVFYVSLGSFDTHADQPRRHEELLGLLAQGLAAFYQEMRYLGREREVLVLGFSEFGRRVQENASYGTDHGKGGLMFALGPVKGGVLGSEPDLEDLDEGDLRFQLDLRAVYAAALRFLGLEPASILGPGPAPIPLV
ncbi:DUF1501 domain-containing protein [Thermus sp. FJN-A]